jgi:hypothetical protein
VDDEGVAHATGEVGPLDVAALCAGVRGVALPLLPAPAHDPLQDALARELGAEPAPPATVEEAHALARALFAALARGSFATLAEAREVH